MFISGSPPFHMDARASKTPVCGGGGTAEAGQPDTSRGGNTVHIVHGVVTACKQRKSNTNEKCREYV